jgi:metal-responsive CopG/Arc/MetJ family transcriptional regulator
MAPPTLQPTRSVRVAFDADEATVAELDKLAQHHQTSRAEVARSAVRFALKHLREEE